MSGRRQRLPHVLMLGIATVFCAQSVTAQDAAHGRELYETHCGGCHFERIHERDRAKSRVQSLQELRFQVGRWSAQTGRSFSAGDLADIVDYLNRTHYRLEK
ncbi:MAG: hypothetical protein A3H35_08510 [Betaproteobacteria bacterium RIFCSPLOWO2_02_FULL_62_17]|nr:MAG: hypothetical protein A3H35_08510 [Betaproteobacteria bacterium RIFCSPLOWO2_02_FULL_62_17]